MPLQLKIGSSPPRPPRLRVKPFRLPTSAFHFPIDPQEDCGLEAPATLPSSPRAPRLRVKNCPALLRVVRTLVTTKRAPPNYTKFLSAFSAAPRDTLCFRFALPVPWARQSVPLQLNESPLPSSSASLLALAPSRLTLRYPCAAREPWARQSVPLQYTKNSSPRSPRLRVKPSISVSHYPSLGHDKACLSI